MAWASASHFGSIGVRAEYEIVPWTRSTIFDDSIGLSTFP